MLHVFTEYIVYVMYRHWKEYVTCFYRVHCVMYRHWKEHVYIILVQILPPLFTCHITHVVLIECPLFLITFDLMYLTFTFYL
jgi:hypothetical protein